MSIPGSASPLFLSAAAAEVAGYQIDRSLRFNSADSAYLNRTPSSAGNRKTWTWSGWVKRSKSAAQYFFAAVPSASAFCQFLFNSDDTISLQFRDSSANAISTTDAVFRDFSAWYHIVFHLDTTQSTASDRMKLWVNGVEQTFSTDARSSITQNGNYEVNNTSQHAISSQQPYASSGYVDGYLAEIHFIDGQALDATDFGEYDDNNLWQPKAYSGTYGTNGFHLDFSDNSSDAALGTDSSGNSNDWTVNNLSVASGAGNDSLIDTPTNYEASPNNGGNYATLNPLNSYSSTLSNGNLDWSSSTGYGQTQSTIAVSSGKWYYEAEITAANNLVGIKDVSVAVPGSAWSGNRAYYSADGTKFLDGTATSYGASFAAGDVIGVALDMDAGTLVFYKNGVSQGTAFTGITGTQALGFLGSNGSAASASINFGQRPFSISSVPTGFLSLCTTNLPDPTIADGSTAMDITTFNNSAQTSGSFTTTITPDLIITKRRDTTSNWVWQDIVRGYGDNKNLHSNLTVAETSTGNITGVSGTTVSYGTNSNMYNSQVAWYWDGGTSTVSNTDGSITSQVRANASAGFSIVTYTGNGGSGATVGHGLGVAPEMIVLKARAGTNANNNWFVWHKNLSANTNINLNNTFGERGTGSFASGIIAAPSSTTFGFTAGSSVLNVNENGTTFVAYCFAPVDGYSNGFSYTGNGSTNGGFVYLGFRPRLILLKCSSTTGNWTLLDTAREGYNVDNDPLYPNLSNSEGTTDLLDITSNGFKLRTTDASVNSSGATYVGFAFAEHPFASNARAR